MDHFYFFLFKFKIWTCTLYSIELPCTIPNLSCISILTFSAFRLRSSLHLHSAALSLVSIQTQRTQRNRKRKPQETQGIALRVMRALRKRNRKQRKRLVGYFDDWLFRSTTLIGWRLRALRLNGNRFTQCFCLRNFIAFLAHFSYAIDCVACVAFGWKPGFRPFGNLCTHNSLEDATSVDCAEKD